MPSKKNNLISQYRILICGGHLAPALAMIDSLRKQGNFRIFFIGRKHFFEGDNATSLEYGTINKLKIPFYSISTGRLQRRFSLEGIKSLIKIPLGFIQSYQYLNKIKPDLILSFGGYISLPVCLIGYLCRIPVVTHEQTSILGLTNRIISLFANKTCLSFNNTKHARNDPRFIITGNPMRESILNSRFEEEINTWDKSLPLIMILGGSSGSHVINQAMSRLITQLVKQYRILHQCGNAYNNKDFKMLWSMKNSLPVRSKRNYIILKQINPQKLGSLYKQSSLIIGRSGANTVMEIAYYNKPAIFVPLSFSADEEQKENAKLLRDAEAAIIIDQNELTPENLMSKINEIFTNLNSYNKNAIQAHKRFFYNGQENILSVITSVLNS